jgi:LCP family protein required for cell wall assembly
VHEAPNNNKNEPRDAFAAQLNNKKPSPKKSWLKTTCLLILVLAAGAAIFFTQTQQGRDMLAMFKDVPTAIKVKQNPDLIFDRVNSNIVNILLIGRDVNYKIIFKNGRPVAHTYDENTPARSDTMILLSLDKVKRTMRMISFPRDALVRMPPNDYHVHIAKLNAAHAYGGPAMLIQALHDDLGITVHRYAVVRFEGFKSLIDKVGGIDVDVIGALHRNGKRGNLNYDDNWANLHIHLKPGMQHLDGTQAHNYVRFRMDLEGDPGRIRRQQQVMRALGKKLTEQPILKIPGLVQEVRRQFKTDMADQEIASAAFFAKSLGNATKIDPVTLFGVYTTKGSITLNRSKNIKLLSYVLGGTFDPSVFLENSPSTERDELGAENDSSPGAQALLRAAGLLGDSSGASETNADVASESSTDPEASSRSFSRANVPVKRSRRSRARIADSSRFENTSASQPQRTERTRAIHELSVDSSTSKENSSVPIRQAAPLSGETTEASPVPRPE